MDPMTLRPNPTDAQTYGHPPAGGGEWREQVGPGADTGRGRGGGGAWNAASRETGRGSANELGDRRVHGAAHRGPRLPGRGAGSKTVGSRQGSVQGERPTLSLVGMSGCQGRGLEAGEGVQRLL